MREESVGTMPPEEENDAVINVTEPGEEVSGSFASAFGFDLTRADLPGFRERLNKIDDSERAAGRVAATVQLR
jgi:hypothetical protein